MGCGYRQKQTGLYLELAADPLFALVVFRRNVADALSITLSHLQICGYAVFYRVDD